MSNLLDKLYQNIAFLESKQKLTLEEEKELDKLYKQEESLIEKRSLILKRARKVE